MGIVRAGCFYVCLDANQPAERLNRILDTLKADLMIADKESLDLAGGISFSGEILFLEDLKSLPDDALNSSLLASIRRQAADTDPFVRDLHLRLHRRAQGCGGEPSLPSLTSSSILRTCSISHRMMSSAIRRPLTLMYL